MNNIVKEIARELDKKPAFIIDTLSRVGVANAKVNTELTIDQVEKLYIRLGLKSKITRKIIPKVKNVVVEDDSYKKKSVVITKKSKKKHDDDKTHGTDKVVKVIKKDAPKKAVIKKEEVKKEQAVANTKVEATKAVEPKVEQAKAVTPKKVETVKSVNTNQTSSNAARPVNNTGARPVNNTGARPANNTGARPANNTGARPANNTGARPANNTGTRPANNTGARPANNTGARPTNNNYRPANNTGARPTNNNYRPANNTGARPTNNNYRPANNTGARPTNNNYRPANNTGARPTNNNYRPANNTGARPTNNNYRPANNTGARPTNNNYRPANNTGARPSYNGTRPTNNTGARPSYNGARPANSTGTRPTNTVNKPGFTKSPSSNAKSYNKKGGNFNKPNEKRPGATKTPGKASRFRGSSFVNGGKRGINEALSEEFILNEYYSNDSLRRRNKKRKQSNIPSIEVLKKVSIPEIMTVKTFSEIIKKQSTEVIMKLMSLDMMCTINDDIDYDTASLVAEEFNIETELEVKKTHEDILFDDSQDDEGLLETRSPVVVVMGHVDHGKTSLLDAIKKTNVVATEAGSITQHIGAYSVDVEDRKITFLDTPGHEAFTAMRKRGADVTDIAIIVVAADDGIMPQTIEAINHAKAAGVTIIIAINKMDVQGANPDRVKQELTKYELVVEDWGGDIICVPVSAMTGEGIDLLLEMVILSADVLELKANPNRQAKGSVIESRLEKSGVIATLLVKRGTLKIGDAIISGVSTGRIKAMESDRGLSIQSAGPSVPVEILGLDEAPKAGDLFYAVDDLKVAKSLSEKRRYELSKIRNKRSNASLEDLFAQIQEGSVKDLNIIVKADVKGSVEAITDSLEKISNEEFRVKVIHGAVGTITESDISLAEVSNAIIIGFNIRPSNPISQTAKNAGVDIKLYRVIYEAIEAVEAAIKGMLAPKFEEVVKGHIEIRKIYKVSGIGTIGGAMVLDGKVERNTDIRVVRDSIVVYEGKLASLKRFKDDVKEVSTGYECGVSVEKYNDIKEGDVIEAFAMEEVKS